MTIVPTETVVKAITKTTKVTVTTIALQTVMTEVLKGMTGSTIATQLSTKSMNSPAKQKNILT